MKNGALSNPLLAKGLKLTHLRMIATFAQTLHIGQAAQSLGITQPAASRLLAEIERICGYPVHVRSGRGVNLTEVGHALALRAGRVMMELHDTQREIDTFGTGQTGQVALGAVTAPALDIVLPAVREARFAYPNIQIDVTVAASDVLFDQLISGKLDFSIARIPKGADATQVMRRDIGVEPVDLVARKGHPLAQLAHVTPADLAQYDWVLASRGNPMTEAVLTHMAAQGLKPPQQQMTTSSFLLTLALLRQSNAIAPLSSAVVHQFASGADSALRRLNIDLGVTVSTYSILTRRDAVLPVAARHVLGIVERALQQAQNAG